MRASSRRADLRVRSREQDEFAEPRQRPKASRKSHERFDFCHGGARLHLCFLGSVVEYLRHMLVASVTSPPEWPALIEASMEDLAQLALAELVEWLRDQRELLRATN